MKTYKLFPYLITLSLVSLQATEHDLNSNTTNIPPVKQDFKLQEGIAKYLPTFFENNQDILAKVQEEERQVVLVIGQAGVGKSTLIGGLLGHKFIDQEKKLIRVVEEEEKLYDDEVLLHKIAGRRKLLDNKMALEIQLPTVYLDKEDNLAFIDTAGLGDTSKENKAIRLCNALALHSLIEQIHGLKCIIAVIDYDLFGAKKGASSFVNLLKLTSDMLKNTTPKAHTSSILLAFTKVPMYITNLHIYEALKDQFDNWMQKQKNKEMTEEDKVAQEMYKAFFPSCYSLDKTKDVPFFLIRKHHLVGKNLVRNNMLPAIQNATKVYSTHIKLALQPYLLQNAIAWLGKRAQGIANDIQRKEYTKEKITHTKKYLLFEQKELRSKKQQLVNYLTEPNGYNKKARLKKCLKETIQKNNQRIENLNKTIKNNKNEVFNKETKKQQLDTSQTILYAKVSGSYNKLTKRYDYVYNNENVPIHYINYNDRSSFYNTKDPKAGDRISKYYKIVSFTKNYEQGILNITLEHDMDITFFVLPNIDTTFDSGSDNLSSRTAKNHVSPGDFHIYAKKKHIYQNIINTLKRDIRTVAKGWLKRTNEKQRLQKENQLIRYQMTELQSRDCISKQYMDNLYNSSNKDNLKKVTLDFLQHKKVIEQAKIAINVQSKKVKSIANDLQTWKTLLTLLSKEIKQNEIIPYMITHLDSFINFNKGDQNNIQICKQYHTSNLKEDNQNSNIDVSEKYRYDQRSKELTQKQDDNPDNNNKKTLSPSSCLILSTGLLANSLFKQQD